MNGNGSASASEFGPPPVRGPILSKGDDDFVNILIDCGKSFREGALQWMIGHEVSVLDAVILSHEHADATFGLDDLRDFSFYASRKGSIPVYVTERDLATISSMFPYLVDRSKATGSGFVPCLDWKTISPVAPFEVEGLTIEPLVVEHGYVGTTPYTCLGFRFGNVVYLSDVSKIPEETAKKIKRNEDDVLDVLVIDSLNWTEKNASHFLVADAINAIKSFRPKKAYLIGMNHLIDHHKVNQQLRHFLHTDNLDIELSYDGMLLRVQL